MLKMPLQRTQFHKFFHIPWAPIDSKRSADLIVAMKQAVLILFYDDPWQKEKYLLISPLTNLICQSRLHSKYCYHSLRECFQKLALLKDFHYYIIYTDLAGVDCTEVQSALILISYFSSNNNATVLASGFTLAIRDFWQLKSVSSSYYNFINKISNESKIMVN